MYVVPIDPLILQVWVPFPFDQVLYLTLSAELPRLQDLFDFVLLLSINKVRRGFRKVGSMELGFMIRGQQVCMEDIMYLPLQREYQLISDRR